MKARLRFGGIGMLVIGAAMAGVALVAGLKAPEGELTHEMRYKDRVIGGVYKVYGAEDCPVPMWLAKTVFRNDTNGRVTDLKIRYKVSEYSDWCSWHQYVAVDPTQTVVDLYYPIFSSACAKLTSRARAELLMEGEYVDPAGRKHQISETRRLAMLERHEFIFSDLTEEERTASFQDQDTYSPLLAAYVSRNDDPVARLASMANKNAGGLGAQTSDEDCIKVMAALYQIMRTIHISYQHPAEVIDEKMSYDSKLVQSLQYPRDTIEKRSGTCIDLAILYATMLNSVDIQPYLVSMDGHCFPMGRTPSGQFVPVEATGVGDGYAKGMDFAEAVKSGTETWEKVNQNGRFNLVDVRKCWMDGIANPELDPLPPDILEKWGIVALVEGSGRTALPGLARGIPAQDLAPRTPASPAIPQNVPAVAGRWAYTVTAPDGRAINGQMQISGQPGRLQLTAIAAYPMLGADGRMHQFREEDYFVGRLSGQSLVAQCTNATYMMDGLQMPPQGLPLQLNLLISPDGRSMQGHVSNATGMAAVVVAQRQQ